MDLEKSMERSLLGFMDKILGTLNNEVHVVGISCGLPRASDCINHEQNLQNLKYS